MKATVDTKGKPRKKTVFGLPTNARKGKREMTGKLVEHFCSKCNVEIVLSPDDCDRVTCGTCTLKAAHNAMLDKDHVRLVNAKPKKEVRK